MSSGMFLVFHGLLALYLAFRKRRGLGLLAAVLGLLGLAWTDLYYTSVWLVDACLLVVCLRPSQLQIEDSVIFFLWSNLCKAVLVHHLACPPAETLGFTGWLWNLINLGGGLSLAILLGRRYWFQALAMVSLILGLVGWVDLVFVRYFQDFPGCYLILQLPQGGAALPGTLALMQWRDSLLILDTLVLLLASVVLRRQKQPLAKRHVKAALASFGLFFVISIFPRVELVSLSGWNRNLRGRNIWIVNVTGLFTYHLLDLQQFLSRDAFRGSRDWNVELWKKRVGASRQSIDEPTPLRGKFAGYNLVFVQLESLQYFALEAEIQGRAVMPLTREFAQQHCLWGGLQDLGGVGRSSDGEFVAINSQVPCAGWPVVYKYPMNKYRGLAWALREMGYESTYAVDFEGVFANCRITSINYGFHHQILRPQLGSHDPEFLRGGQGLNDVFLFERVLPVMKSSRQPFYFHVVTVSGHYPFKEVLPTERKLTAPPGLENTQLMDFLECCARKDHDLFSILESFRKSGLWENSVFCFYGDHDAGVPEEELARFLGIPYTPFNKIVNDKVAFFIHFPDESRVGKIEHPMMSLADLAPTLAHLLGVPGNLTEMTGLNLFSQQRHEMILAQGGAGYALTKDKIVVPGQNRVDIFERSFPHKMLPLDKELVKQVQEEFRLVEDSFRLNVQGKWKE